jgi:hypothetical protein
MKTHKIYSTDMSDDQLTPQRRVLEKLILAQLVKKFIIFCGNQRFITMFTRASY